MVQPEKDKEKVIVPQQPSHDPPTGKADKKIQPSDGFAASASAVSSKCKKKAKATAKTPEKQVVRTPLVVYSIAKGFF